MLRFTISDGSSFEISSIVYENNIFSGAQYHRYRLIKDSEMLSDNELAETSAQLQDFHVASTKQQATLAEVLEKYGTLIESYKRLKSDYEEERDSRERY